MRPSFDCATPHTTTASDRFNHVEIYLARDKLDVWASDPSPDGREFSNFQRFSRSTSTCPSRAAT